MYPTQRWCKNVGENGCYYLCLHYVAEQKMNGLLDFVRGYKSCVDLGFMSNEGWVLDAGKILSFLTNSTWSYRHETNTYLPKFNEREILRFEHKTAKGVMSHFVVGDGYGKVEYDPFEPSETVRLGAMVSKRIVWEV